MSAAAPPIYMLGPLADAKAPAAGLGLSKGHIRPHGRFTLMRGAGYGKIDTLSVGTFSTAPLTGGNVLEASVPRGKITEFSNRSRQRLRILIASICRKDLPLFSTLTYPNEWVWDSSVWKRHLKVFSQRLNRQYPNAGFIWKLEFQSRGAPHFHQFLWGIPADSFNSVLQISNGKQTHHEFIEWISRTWFEVVCSGDEKHLRAGTRVERIRTPQGALRYVSGYASKSDQTLPGRAVGRYWGIVGRDNIPWGTAESTLLNGEQLKTALRTARRFIASMSRQRQIRHYGKQIACNYDEVIEMGWFSGEHRGHRKACGRWKRKDGLKILPKLRLRNLSSMNIFLDADFWAQALPKLLSLTPPRISPLNVSAAADMLSLANGHSAAAESNLVTVKSTQDEGLAEFMTAVRNIFPDASVIQ